MTEATDERLWSGDDRSSLEKAPGSGGWTGRWRRPGLGRTSGLRQTAKPDGMLLVWRRRHGVFRIGEGDGRHGGSAAGELLSSPLPWLSRSGERPRLLSTRQKRLGGADGGEEAAAAAGACFLRRRGMIPTSQECFLRSLAPP